MVRGIVLVKYFAIASVASYRCPSYGSPSLIYSNECTAVLYPQRAMI